MKEILNGTVEKISEGDEDINEVYIVWIRGTDGNLYSISCLDHGSMGIDLEE